MIDLEGAQGTGAPLCVVEPDSNFRLCDGFLGSPRKLLCTLCVVPPYVLDYVSVIDSQGAQRLFQREPREQQHLILRSMPFLTLGCVVD